MLEDIKKILNISKNNSIVVMDEGEPAYVIVPFKEYSENMSMLNTQKTTNKIDGESDSFRDELDDLNAMLSDGLIDSDFNLNQHDYHDNLQEVDELESIGDKKMKLREIKLEDLPF